MINEQQPRGALDGSLQTGSVLREAGKRIGAAFNLDLEQALLTNLNDLFRTGYLAWGFNLSNPSPPFFHITDRGRKSLAVLSRDPSNPDGYFSALARGVTLNPIADSYIREAVACLINDLPKAAAVMVGGASESMALELRDAITQKLHTLKRGIPKGIDDWRFKVVLDSMYSFLDQNATQMSRELRESFKSYWPAFLQQIRSTRNDAGHPSSVEPVTFEAVHAALLIFPELARLAGQLLRWVTDEYK